MEELDELKPLSKGNEGLRKHGRVGAVVGMDGRGRGGDGDSACLGTQRLSLPRSEALERIREKGTSLKDHENL
jgi:hypothetical protein